MRKTLLPIAAAVALAMGAAAPAHAVDSTIYLNLTQAGFSGSGPWGDVTFTDGGDYVDVVVTLYDTLQFVNTPQHLSVGFNLDITNATISQIKYGDPAADCGGCTAILNTASTASPYGSFNYGVDVPGNGGSSPTADPISFRVAATGIGLTNFIANAGGYTFVVDAFQADGGVTGSIASAAPIPEPSTYALMFAGLAAVGFMARRRRQA